MVSQHERGNLRREDETVEERDKVDIDRNKGASLRVVVPLEADERLCRGS